MTQKPPPFEKIFRIEPTEDIIKFLATLKNAPDLPRMDRLFSRRDWPNTSSYELILTYQRLLDTGVIQLVTPQGKIGKGPHWTEPAFLADHRYES